MAGELQFRYSATGSTLYMIVRNAAGQCVVQGTGAVETQVNANWDTYDFALTETPASGYHYVGTMVASAAGWYRAEVYLQAGAGPALTDALVGEAEARYWSGTAFVDGYPLESADTGATAVARKGADSDTLETLSDQLDGTFDANVTKILDTALTESVAGYLAAAFVKFLDVATPVLTAASVNQTGDAFARIGATGSGLTSLAQAASWTSALATALGTLAGHDPGATIAKAGDAMTLTEAYDAAKTAAAEGAAMTLTEAYDAAKTAAAEGAAMALTSDERSTLAEAIETAILNELDGEAVLAAIATAVRDAILNRVLSGNHDTADTPGKILQTLDAAFEEV